MLANMSYQEIEDVTDAVQLISTAEHHQLVNALLEVSAAYAEIHAPSASESDRQYRALRIAHQALQSVQNQPSMLPHLSTDIGVLQDGEALIDAAKWAEHREPAMRTS